MGKQTCWRRARVGRLGLLDEKGAPRVLPVTFAVAEGRIWSAIDQKPKRAGEPARLRFLRRDPRAALTVDRYSDDWDELAWVQVLGSVRILEVAEGAAGWRRSARSTSSTGRRRLRVRCWLWSRSGICGGELRIRRAEAGVAAAAAGDQNLVAGGGAFHPVAEVIAKEMGADGDFGAITFGLGSGARGLEPPTSRLPGERSPN